MAGKTLSLHIVMSKVLIQLIGEQTLPNLMPVLSIRPDRVVNIFTDATIEQHQQIKDWCRRFGKKYEIHPEFPDYAPIKLNLADIQNGIRGILLAEMDRCKEHPGSRIILNMTGGTKLMSAIAMSFCMQMHKSLPDSNAMKPVPIVYLNSVNREIEFVTCANQRDEVLVHHPSDFSLKVKDIIEASGKVVVSAHPEWKQVYPAAQRLQKLAREDVYFDFNEVKKDNYVEASKSPLSSLLRSPSAKALERFRNLALAAEHDEDVCKGLSLCRIVPRDGDFYFSANLQKEVESLAMSNKGGKSKYEKIKNACRALNGVTNFFVGGWWEVIVAHAYQTLYPNAEVLWSVETAEPNDREHPVETDIIASDGHSLCCISCKRGIHKSVTQELEQHCTRTALLGGVIHKRIIAVYRKDAAYMIGNLAVALRLALWTSEDVEKIERGTLQQEPRVMKKQILEKAPEEPEEPEQANLKEKKDEQATTPAAAVAAPVPPTEKLPFLKRLGTAIRVLVSGRP